METRRRRPARPSIALLIAITMIGPLALNIFVPSIPSLIEVFESDLGAVQLTLTVFLVTIAFGQLLYGPFSDRFGRRRVLLVGLVLYILGSAMAALAPTLGLLVAARFLQALGGCAGMVLARAIVRDLFERERAASLLGYITVGMGVAPALAPVIGGQLHEWFGWRASFVFTGFFGIAILTATALRLPETNHRPVVRLHLYGMLHAMGYLLGRGEFLRPALALGFLTGMFFAFLSAAPYLSIEVLGASPRGYALAFVSTVLCFMTGSFLAGRLSQRVGNYRMGLIAIGFALASASLLTVFELTGQFSMVTLFAPMCLAAIGNGIGQPNFIAAGVSVRPELAGTASGLLGAFQMGIGAIITVVVGESLGGRQGPMVIAMGVSALIATAAYLSDAWPRLAARLGRA